MANGRIKRPAYQWYPADADGDEVFRLMSYEQQGVYHRLLDHQWNEGSIPADPDRLAALLPKMSRDRFLEIWPLIAAKFRPTGEARLMNDRLEFQRRKLNKYIAVQKRNAAKRRPSRTSAASHGSAMAQPRDESSSSSSITTTTKNKERKHMHSDHADEHWDAFKAIYPAQGRQGGYMALQRFLAACDAVGVAALMAGVTRYAASKKVKEGYVIGMEKWLEKEMWIQEPEAAEVSSNVSGMEAELAKIDAERAARGR